jgi:hypothetical protein
MEILSSNCENMSIIFGGNGEGEGLRPARLLAIIYISIPGVKTRTVNNFDRLWAIRLDSFDKPLAMTGDIDVEKIVGKTDLINRILFPVFEKARLTEAQSTTLRRGIRLMAVLEAYKLEHGQYPDRLDQLVGSYVSTMPPDPFADGKPFKYSRKGEKYLLYSIGQDFKDDGGKVVQPYAMIGPGSGGGDIVFAPGLDIWQRPD